MEGENIDVTCKIVVIGDSGVGKTYLIWKYAEDRPESELTSTAGGVFYYKIQKLKENNKVISLDIWDTSGIEKYRYLADLYTKDANVIIMVYDSVNENSFMSIKDYWYPQIKKVCIKNPSKI